VKVGSLRLRLAAAGAAAIAVALFVAGAGLILLFERHATRALVEDLDVYLRQLAAGVEIDSAGRLLIARSPADPRFAEPLSGLYWQAQGSGGEMERSRSLWDTFMALPSDTPEAGAVHRHDVVGPAGQQLLVAERLIKIPSATSERPVRIAVGADRARIAAARAAFTRDLVPALLLLGAVLGAAAWVQIGLGLKPLALLRRGVVDIRSGVRDRLPLAVPIEVRPLVDEVNALLDAQQGDVERARHRAADLAHGLKTPLAALAGDVRRLREKGEDGLATSIENVSETMRRHVDRELIRARLRSTPTSKMLGASELRTLIASIVATLGRTPAGEHVNLEIEVSERAAVPFGTSDLADVLGNLLENAVRYARSMVKVTAAPVGPSCRIEVEDDGPGVPIELRSKITERGERLDQRGSAGLGLAIVQDILEAYGWQVALGSSVLGGLKASIASSAASPPGDGTIR
jgi:signal transduction histidine kinase